MGARTPTPQGPDPRGQPVDPGPDPGPRPAPAAPPGATLNIGPILARTVGHFFPELNAWIDGSPTRGSRRWWSITSGSWSGGG